MIWDTLYVILYTNAFPYKTISPIIDKLKTPHFTLFRTKFKSLHLSDKWKIKGNKVKSRKKIQ